MVKIKRREGKEIKKEKNARGTKLKREHWSLISWPVINILNKNELKL